MLKFRVDRCIMLDDFAHQWGTPEWQQGYQNPCPLKDVFFNPFSPQVPITPPVDK